MSAATFAVLATTRRLLQRELAAVRRSIEAYPDDASIWSERPGVPNTGGNLALHLAGNLQHYFGAVLGETGYRRNRDAEFARRGVSRTELLGELDAARQAIDAGMNALTPERLSVAYPEQVGGRTISTGEFLVHLLSHLAYHLGQLDYHRRLVTGDRTSVAAIAVAGLASS